MKRIAVVLLAFALSLGGAGAALADGIDMKVRGQWDFAFGWAHNAGFKDSIHNNSKTRDDDNFLARQRIRTQINFITSEYLQAVLMFEIGDLDWGRANGNTGPGSGGALDADGVNVETKRAYLDWVIPNTEVSVRMGIQGITLPSTPMGSPLFDADVAGIVISAPVTDWLAASLVWLRPFDAYQNDSGAFGFTDNDNFSDEVDAFALLLPMQFDGLNITPYGIYSLVGANSGLYDYVFAAREGGLRHDNSVTRENGRTQAFWLGTHMEMTLLDPLVLNLEAIYGHLKPVDLTGFAHPETQANAMPGLNKGWSLNRSLGTSGWFLAATLDYKLDWMTPGIFGWWSSGDGENADHDGKYGRLPVLGNDGGSFGPTTFGSAGTYGIGTEGAIMGSGAGTWGIGLQFADVTFIEDLSHTLRFAYYRGTNDPELIRKGYVTNESGDVMVGVANDSRYATDAMYLTRKDSVFEINFDHSYKIYDNLTAVLELGYLHLKADRDVWKHQSTKAGISGQRDESDNAWKAELNFRYEF